MTLTDFIPLVRTNIGLLDPDVVTDAIVEDWVRQAEERASSELRISDMIQIDQSTILYTRVSLPPDWRENDFVRLVDRYPLRYKDRDAFYNTSSDMSRFYTIEGRFLSIGGAADVIDGKVVELSYFGDVQPLTTSSDSWLRARYPMLFMALVMNCAGLYSSDYQSKTDWGAVADARIDKLNTEYRRSIASGSRLNRQMKGFG